MTQSLHIRGGNLPPVRSGANEADSFEQEFCREARRGTNSADRQNGVICNRRKKPPPKAGENLQNNTISNIYGSRELIMHRK